MFTKKTPEEKEEIKRQKQREKEEISKQWEIEKQRKIEEKREKKFLASPQGKARTAFKSGAKLFQIDLPISETLGVVVSMSGTYTSDVNFNNASILEGIESEGWKLENTGYVYRVLGTVSRDKFLSSGQQEAISGEIVGIYIFRRDE